MKKISIRKNTYRKVGIFLIALMWTVSSQIRSVHAGETTYAAGASGTFNTPAGTTTLIVELWGGGGGGGAGPGNTTGAGGGGGGGGAYVIKTITSPASSYTYAVGNSGPGGAINNNGTAGGDTTFVGATTYTAGGGKGGIKGPLGAGGSGGTGTLGDTNRSGGKGATAVSAQSGGGGGGAGTTAAGGDGGTPNVYSAGTGGSALGGDGGAGCDTSANCAGGNASASGYGGGGGGGMRNAAGGHGIGGYIRLTYYGLPTLTTQAVSDVTSTSATGNGTIVTTGDIDPTRRGFAYMVGTSGDPTTSNIVVYTDGSYGTGAYALTIPDLTPGTGYRVRAYATNTQGTGYGTTVQLTTNGSLSNFSGIIYQEDEASPYLCATNGTLTVYIRVNGVGSYSGTCTENTGAWSISSVAVDTGVTVLAYISGGSVRGSTVLISDNSSQSNLHIMQNRVTLRDDANGSITNAEILAGNTADGDDLINTTGTDVVVASTYEIHIYTGDTYAPGANVSTGSLHMVGNYTGSSETITLTGTSGTLFNRSGIFTQGTTEVIVTSASGTPNLLSAATTFHKLTINSAATVINANQAITLNSADNSTLTVTQGVLNDSGYGITGPGAGTGRTLTVSAGASLCLGGSATNSVATCNSSSTSSTTRALPSFQSYSFAATSTILYLSNADTAVSATPTYGNLMLNPTLTDNRAYTFGGAATINGDFTVNPTASSTYTLTTYLGGTTTVAATKITKISGTTSGLSNLDTVDGVSHTLSTGFLNIDAGGTLTARVSDVTLTGASSTIFTRVGTFIPGTSTVTFNQSTGNTVLTFGTVTFNNVVINMSGRTGTLGNTIEVSNNLTLTAGTLADGGHQITGNTTGTLASSSGAYLKLGTTATATTFPTLFTTTHCNLNVGSYVVYQAGVAQTVSSTPTYGNLSLSPTITGAVAYTFGSGTTTVRGNFDITPTSGGVNALTVSMAGPIDVATTTTITKGSSATSTLDTVSGSDYALTTGNLTIESGGTLLGQGATITVHGNWANAGIFTTGTSSVIFDMAANTSTVSGTTTFYNFICTSQRKPLTFTGASTQTIANGGTFRIKGPTCGNAVVLNSTDASQWTIAFAGSATIDVDYVNVAYAKATGSTVTVAHAIDSGNNDATWSLTTTACETPTDFILNFSGIDLQGLDIQK